MDVGIRELKARLSEYVERASRGEPIRVTDRGKAKAILVPVPGQIHLAQGIAEGWIEPPTRDVPTTWKRFSGSLSVDDLLREDRLD